MRNRPARVEMDACRSCFINANSGGTPARRDRPRVCPTPIPMPTSIQFADRITYFALSLWFGIYYTVLVGRGADSKSPLNHPLNHPSGFVPTLITPREEKERWKTSPEILTTLA